MSYTRFRIKPKTKKIYSIKTRIIKSVYNNINLIFYFAAISTIGGGILHLLMLGPSLKPTNFPMMLLPYTDSLFTISGILQIFWCIPMIKRWGVKWYYIGLIGTIGLSMLLLITRIPNGITNLPLEDKNPMALLTEITQFLYIGVTTIIIKHAYAASKFNKIGNTAKSINKSTKLKNDNDHYWFKERYYITSSVIEEENNKSFDKNINIDLKKAEFLNSKGVRLRKLGRDEEALKHFEEVLKIYPTYTNALYNKGVSLNRIGKKDEAIEIYTKAKELVLDNS